jgi:hypothetical protein
MVNVVVDGGGVTTWDKVAELPSRFRLPEKVAVTE